MRIHVCRFRKGATRFLTYLKVYQQFDGRFRNLLLQSVSIQYQLLTNFGAHEILWGGNVTVDPRTNIPKPTSKGFFAHDDMGKQPNRFGQLAIAFTLLMVTFPLMLFVALAIKIESNGPVLESEE
jgi:hypothetical protein